MESNPQPLDLKSEVLTITPPGHTFAKANKMVMHGVLFDHVCTIGSPQFDAILEHPDWKFGKRLPVGESAIIYLGMYDS